MGHIWRATRWPHPLPPLHCGSEGKPYRLLCSLKGALDAGVLLERIGHRARVGQRQGEGKDTATAWLALLEPELAVHRFDELAREVQPQPCPTNLADER